MQASKPHPQSKDSKTKDKIIPGHHSNLIRPMPGHHSNPVPIPGHHSNPLPIPTYHSNPSPPIAHHSNPIIPTYHSNPSPPIAHHSNPIPIPSHHSNPMLIPSHHDNMIQSPPLHHLGGATPPSAGLLPTPSPTHINYNQFSPPAIYGTTPPSNMGPPLFNPMQYVAPSYPHSAVPVLPKGQPFAIPNYSLPAGTYQVSSGFHGGNMPPPRASPPMPPSPIQSGPPPVYGQAYWMHQPVPRLPSSATPLSSNLYTPKSQR